MSETTEKRAIYLDHFLREAYPGSRSGMFGPSTAGHVTTKYGIVAVDYACYERRIPGANARMSFIHNGYQYDRIIKRKYRPAFSNRGLVTLARRFAQDVVDGHE